MLAKHLGVTPNDIDNMLWFEVQYMIEDLQEYLKEEAKENERQNQEYSRNTPKIPKTPKSSVPNMKMPRF